MTDITERLKAVRAAEFEINALVEHIESLHRIMRLPRSKEHAEKIVEKLAKLEEAVNKRIDVLCDQKEAVEELLDALPAEERVVMYQYYVLAKDWQTIAREMYISERNVYYLRKKAFKELESKEEKGE